MNLHAMNTDMNVHDTSRWLENWKTAFDRKWEGRLKAYVHGRAYTSENTLEQDEFCNEIRIVFYATENGELTRTGQTEWCRRSEWSLLCAWCEHCLQYDSCVTGSIDIRKLTVDTPHDSLENMPRHYTTQRCPYAMLRNPFFVTMTVGVPDVPIPASFDEHENWGNIGELSELFRKKMTAILWNACDETRDTPHSCEYWLSEFDSCRSWHGPPHYTISRPASPAWEKGSLEDEAQVLEHAKIFKTALENVINCFHDAVNHNDYILWDQTWDMRRKWRWIKNQRTIFQFQVLGPDRRINTYKLTHEQGTDIGRWIWYKNQSRNPLIEDVD